VLSEAGLWSDVQQSVVLVKPRRLTIQRLLLPVLLGACAAQSLTYKPVSTFTSWTIVEPTGLSQFQRFEANSRYGCFEAQMDSAELDRFLAANQIPVVDPNQVGKPPPTVSGRVSDCSGNSVSSCSPAQVYFSERVIRLTRCLNGFSIGSQPTRPGW
jgi:hypothetical protein